MTLAVERTVELPAARPARGVHQVRLTLTSLLLTGSAGVVAVLSYSCTLLMTHALPVADFGAFAAAQMLLGVVGVVSLALVPLPLADAVRSHPAGSIGRRRGMAFAQLVSVLTGVVAAVVTGGLTVFFAEPAVTVAVAASALVLFLVAPVWGWLQGELRFVGYAAGSVAEVAVRLVFSAAAVALGWGAAGATSGFLVGGVVVLLAGVAALRRDLVWIPGVLRERHRWSDTGDVALNQLVVTTLVAADVVIVATLGGHSVRAAGYAALATLAKGPIYVAAGTVFIAFPLLREAGAPVGEILRSSLRTFALMALPTAAVLGTVPEGVAALVLPAQYAEAVDMLPWMAVSGCAFAVVTVLATVLLAVRARRRSLWGLLLAVVVVVVGQAIGWRLGAVDGLAAGTAAGAVVAAVGLLVLAAPVLPAGTRRAATTALVAAGAFVGVLALLRDRPWAWLLAVALAGALVLNVLLRRRPAPERETGPTGGLRILHLGFEDPAMPGAGGGSVRTHEVNRRIARTHRVTVLVQRFPGGADRTQDGVRYVHVGLGRGRTRVTRLVGYVVMLPAAVRRHPSDLVVEDFFAPISTMAAPLWSGRPTVGVVQWLNAVGKSRQYRLPFGVVERLGVRSHSSLVAMSHGLSEQLRAMNPSVHTEVIGNGVDRTAFSHRPRLGHDVVFVGRLESAQKGVDLLLRAWARAESRIPAVLVIAGTGPDERRLRGLAAELGIAHRVRFIGWTSGPAKYELFASARIVVVPSRYESFGMVAVEALATGTPVVAFDIPCLREVVPAPCGRRVTPFDVPAYADELVDAYHDLAWVEAAVGPARAFAARHDWDSVAQRQLDHYLSRVPAAAGTVETAPEVGA